MRNVSDKSFRENQNTHFVLGNFLRKIVQFYELMWKYIVERDGPQMTIWRMRIARCVRKATNTHVEYVILVAFPLQQWLHERASLLRHTYISCLVGSSSIDVLSDSRQVLFAVRCCSQVTCTVYS